jgi:hypothetical protein
MSYTTRPLDASTWDGFAEELPRIKHKREYEKGAPPAAVSWKPSPR